MAKRDNLPPVICRRANVLYFVLSHVFTFLVPCCDVRYHFRMKAMLVSSLPPVVCVRAHILFVICVC